MHQGGEDGGADDQQRRNQRESRAVAPGRHQQPGHHRAGRVAHVHHAGEHSQRSAVGGGAAQVGDERRGRTGHRRHAQPEERGQRRHRPPGVYPGHGRHCSGPHQQASHDRPPAAPAVREATHQWPGHRRHQHLRGEERPDDARLPAQFLEIERQEGLHRAKGEILRRLYPAGEQQAAVGQDETQFTPHRHPARAADFQLCGLAQPGQL